MPRNNMRDANEPEIVAYFKSRGASVMKTDDVDLIVGFDGRNYLVEVKKHKTPGMHRKSYDLNPRQVKIHEEWRGQICVVRDVDDAKRLLFGPDRT